MSVCPAQKRLFTLRHRMVQTKLGKKTQTQFDTIAKVQSLLKSAVEGQGERDKENEITTTFSKGDSQVFEQ